MIFSGLVWFGNLKVFDFISEQWDFMLFFFVLNLHNISASSKKEIDWSAFARCSRKQNLIFYYHLAIIKISSNTKNEWTKFTFFHAADDAHYARRDRSDGGNRKLTEHFCCSIKVEMRLDKAVVRNKRTSDMEKWNKGRKTWCDHTSVRNRNRFVIHSVFENGSFRDKRGNKMPILCAARSDKNFD